MATLVQIVPLRIDKLADFTTFGQAIGTALSTFGWTKDTSVSGTVNWGTITQVPYQSQAAFPTATTVTFRGAYSAAAVSYSINDTVTLNGNTYICTVAYTSSASTPQPGFELGNPGGSAQRWTLYPFEIWKSATTPTIFIKFEFNGNAADFAWPLIRITVATSDDTNGTMGGGAGNQVTTAISFPITNVSTVPEGMTLPCYFSGDSGGRFAMMFWPDLVGTASFWGVERSLDNTGAYYTTPSGAVTPYWTTVSHTYSGSIQMQSLINTTGSTWIKTTADTKITTISYAGNHASQFESVSLDTGQGSANFSVPALPVYPLVGWVGNPLTIALSGKLRDLPALGSFTTLMYGSTRTYLATRNTNFSTFGEGNNNDLAMRYD